MKDLKLTPMFTSGQVARLCSVAPRTAARWIDSGLLAGFRLPGCNDRRVAREVLVRFLRANGFGFVLDQIGEAVTASGIPVEK